MHVCMECDIIEDMSHLEKPQCDICGSTMYPINPKQKNGKLNNEHHKKYYRSLKIRGGCFQW